MDQALFEPTTQLTVHLFSSSGHAYREAAALTPQLPFLLALLVLLFMFTCLVADCTGCLTCGLTGSLAFPASAFFHRVLQFDCIECLDMFHDLLTSIFSTCNTLGQAIFTLL